MKARFINERTSKNFNFSARPFCFDFGGCFTFSNFTKGLSVNAPIYYTCFAIKDVNPNFFHCTHKFLGVQDLLRVSDLKTAINRYFEIPRVVPGLAFTKVDYLGPEYERAILLNDFGNKKYLFLDLRRELDNFRKDDFPHWLPHISGKHDIAFVKFNQFHLMEDGKPILTFEI